MSLHAQKPSPPPPLPFARNILSFNRARNSLFFPPSQSLVQLVDGVADQPLNEAYYSIFIMRLEEKQCGTKHVACPLAGPGETTGRRAAEL